MEENKENVSIDGIVAQNSNSGHEVKSSPMIENLRLYITKTGRIRTDKLKPIVFHDNRSGGSYCIGKNAAKRAKKAALKK